MDLLCFSSLTATETVDLIARSRAVSAAEQSLLEEEIVRRYQPMTRRLASRFAGYGADLDDLSQVANMALIKAVRGFHAERGCFESYAKATISGELKKHLRDHCWSIRPPRRIQELQSQIAQSSAELAQQDGLLPRPDALAQYIGATVSDITEALSARSCYTPSSLDEPLGETGRSLAENLSGDDEPYATVDGHVTLTRICTDLSDADRELIRLRFYECLSQRAIAEQLGISQMQVSRRLSQLLDQLRAKACVTKVA